MDEVIEKLLKQDSNYSESKFKSKVENMFVQIKLAIVTGKIQKIDHFVNDETYNKIEQKVQEDIANNRIQIYDELNVSDIQIKNIEELEECFQIKVQFFSKSLEYYINKETRQYLSGNNHNRTERYTDITFTKMKNAKQYKVVRKCPYCGTTIDVNINGRCDYCHKIFDLENYDWIITKMEIQQIIHQNLKSNLLSSNVYFYIK